MAVAEVVNKGSADTNVSVLRPFHQAYNFANRQAMIVVL